MKSDFTSSIAEDQRLVEATLPLFLPLDGSPDVLLDAMRYSLMAGGKRLRPLLVLMACRACRGNPDDAMPAACAVEMVHTYSLIHDDLPAMDDDDLRRGKPTSHKVYGEANAILAGDALLTLAFEVLATRIHPPAVAAKCCASLAYGAGPQGMVAGQVLDLEAETNHTKSVAQLENIHRRKTGALIVASLEMGGLIAGASDEQLKHLKKYGQLIGLAFQIVDDILDCTGDAEVVGKNVRKDAASGKATYPELLGLEESRRHANNLVHQACDELQIFGSGAQELSDLARYLIERDR